MALCTVLAACGGGVREEEQEEHGPEGSGEPGSDVPFVSDGISRGIFESIPLADDESFAGLLNDTEVAVRFDAEGEKFIGRLRNEAPVAVCDVSASVTLDGFQTVNQTASGDPFGLAGLSRFGRASFEFPQSGVTFTDWSIEVETFGCTSAPDGSGEGGEGGEGSEGNHEEGGDEGGDEGGGEDEDEASPPIPLTEGFSGVFQNQKFAFAFDTSTGAFRGTVENPTSETICESRTEIHLGVGDEVIELGPTIPVDLSPAEIIKIVMSADGYALDTYSLHPESSPCQ